MNTSQSTEKKPEQSPQHIKGNNLKENNEQFLRFLNRGSTPFDYERRVFESQFERLLRIYDGKFTPPYEVEIQPSSRCNINCVWCVGGSFPKLENILGKKEMRKITADLVDFEEDGFKVDTIKFSGFVGEPLVNPATIDGLEILIAAGKRVGLFTNGILLDRMTDDNRRYLDVVADASYIHLSLDAGSPETYSMLKGKKEDFERIMRNLKEIVSAREKRKSKLEIGVGYIITPENYLEIVPICTMLKDYGVDFIRFKVDITGKKILDGSADSATEELNAAMELNDSTFRVVSIHQQQEMAGKVLGVYDTHYMPGIKCYTSKLWGTIGSDGLLYGCDHRTRPNGEPDGDLKKYPIRQVWKMRNGDLPNERCVMCSPFGRRVNEFLSFLFSLERDEIVRLHEEQVGGKYCRN